MKRCPQCFEIYQGTGIFCENDGLRLLDLPGTVVSDHDRIPDGPPQKSNSPIVVGVLVGVLAGVALCAIAFISYSFLKPEAETREHTRSTLEAQVREPSQPPPAPIRSVEAEPAPSQNPSPEPEANASPEPQQPQTETVSARLNRGPVSTGEPPSQRADDAQMKTIIEMHDGSVFEVDAAWKDAQGVWYRRGGLVSFVESPRVKAITTRPEVKDSPVDNR